MATWEYTELKLKKQTGFILKNVEKLHIGKEPYDSRSDRYLFPIKPKPTEGPQEHPTTAAAGPGAQTEEQRSSNIEWKTWSPCMK